MNETKQLGAWYEKRTQFKAPTATPQENYLAENINKNMLPLIKSYPDVVFYMAILPQNIMCHLPLEKSALVVQNRAYIEVLVYVRNRGVKILM